MPKNQPVKYLDVKKRLQVYFVIFVFIAIAIGFITILQGVYKDSSKKINSVEYAYISFEFENLEPLVKGFYQAWLQLQDDSYYDLGKFRVDENSTMLNLENEVISEISFRSDLNPKNIIVTVESESQEIDAPGEAVLLAGNLDGAQAQLRFAPIPANDYEPFVNIETNTSTEHIGAHGVWFYYYPSQQSKDKRELSLHRLCDNGWAYQAWLIWEDTPFNVGRFCDAGANDNSKKYYSGTDPFYPGEDFLENLPEDIPAPLSLLSGDSYIFITLEPHTKSGDPTGRYPFFLRLYSVQIPAGSTSTQYKMQGLNYSKMPQGKAIINY